MEPIQSRTTAEQNEVLLDVPPYIPRFFWRFWLADANPTTSRHALDDHRMHTYDVFNNTLSETRRIPEQTKTIFQDFLTDTSDEESCSTAHDAEQAFTLLENEVERILTDLVHALRSSPDARSLSRRELSIPKRSHGQIVRYFVFLHYRNSEQFKQTVGSLMRRVVSGNDIVEARHSWHRIKRRAVLASYRAFLRRESLSIPHSHMLERLDYRRFYQAEICIGIAGEGCQYVLPDTCCTSLDENFGADLSSAYLLFPIKPTVALYILGTQDLGNPVRTDPPAPVSTDQDVTKIDVGFESVSDVHLRNAALLQRKSTHLYFSSLSSIVRTLSSYDEFRWIPEHLDYSRLKQRARQKATLEEVKMTLLIKGSALLVDLTDEVTKVGHYPVYHGGFADVWKGIWTKATGKPIVVALKFLRQYDSVTEDVKEKVLKRLKAEIVAWHRLQHPNVAPLFGIFQSQNMIAMVSPWCSNGTIMEYIERDDVRSDRLELLLQVASGVSYLHDLKPVVIHGDLKGTNVLIDDSGHPLITDFGLSNVLEEISFAESGSRAAKLGTSLLAGSVRWMAPELVLALVQDDGTLPSITTASDVYSFACVCLEVVTGQPPYAHRRNDCAITMDIIRGVKPSTGVSAACKVELLERQRDTFWNILNSCWDAVPAFRPTMTMVKEVLITAAERCT